MRFFRTHPSSRQAGGVHSHPHTNPHWKTKARNARKQTAKWGLRCALGAVAAAGAMICSPVIVPCLGYWGSKKASKEGRKRMDRCKPRVSNRTRGTIQLERNGGGLKSKTSKKKSRFHEQEQSLWFRLPAELREMIYDEYFRGAKNGVVSIGFDKKKRLRGSHGEENVDVMSLVLTCKKIYVEALLLLYSTPTFSFADPISFLGFCATITPARFDNIRNVHIDFRELKLRRHDNGWPEPPWVGIRRGCVRGRYEPVDCTPILCRPFSYQAFRLSQMQNFYNPLVFEGMSNAEALLKRSKNLPSTWVWMCGVLSKMKSLEVLNIQMLDSCQVRTEEGIKTPLEKVKPEGVDRMRTFTVRLYTVQGNPVLYLDTWPRPHDVVEYVSGHRRAMKGEEAVWKELDGEAEEDESETYHINFDEI